MDIKNNKRYVLGIDIGGTSIKPQLFEVVGDKLSETPVWEAAQ